MLIEIAKIIENYVRLHPKEYEKWKRKKQQKVRKWFW